MVIKLKRLSNYFLGRKQQTRQTWRRKERADCVGPPSMVLCADRKVAGSGIRGEARRGVSSNVWRHSHRPAAPQSMVMSYTVCCMDWAFQTLYRKWLHFKCPYFKQNSCTSLLPIHNRDKWLSAQRHLWETEHKFKVSSLIEKEFHSIPAVARAILLI